MKRLLIAVASLSIFAFSAVALADPPQDRGHGNDQGQGWSDHGHGHDHDRDHGNDRDRGDDHHDNGRHLGWDKHYGRGDRLPPQYRGREYYVDNYAEYHLHRPRPGYRWVRGDNGQFVLVAVATGLITEVLLGH